MTRALLLVVLALLTAGCAGERVGPRDADGDGVPDAQEATAHPITVTYANGTTETRSVSSDANVADTDGDGLGDADELARQTDPRSIDTDRDGLLDGSDRNATGDQAKLWRDQGIVESPPGSGHFLGELSYEGTCSLKPTVGSSDVGPAGADKLADGLEIAGWNVSVRGFARHVTSDPCLADTDHDGLLDDAEKTLGSDPRAEDTDGDGVRDVADADPLWDLGIRFENVTASGTHARVNFSLGSTSGVVEADAGKAASFNVNDTTATRASLPVLVIVTAKDRSNATALDLFGDARGAYFTADILAGTTAHANGADEATRHVTFRGPDGTLSFDWVVTRS